MGQMSLPILVFSIFAIVGTMLYAERLDDRRKARAEKEEKRSSFRR